MAHNDKATRAHAESVIQTAFEGDLAELTLAGHMPRSSIVNAARDRFTQGSRWDGNGHGHGTFNRALAAELVDAAFAARGIK